MIREPSHLRSQRTAATRSVLVPERDVGLQSLLPWLWCLGGRGPWTVDLALLSCLVLYEPLRLNTSFNLAKHSAPTLVPLPASGSVLVAFRLRCVLFPPRSDVPSSPRRADRPGLRGPAPHGIRMCFSLKRRKNIKESVKNETGFFNSEG